MRPAVQKSSAAKQNHSNAKSRPTSSVEDSFDEPLTDYETPGTSVAVTPLDGSHTSRSNRSSAEKRLKSIPKVLAMRTTSSLQVNSRSSSIKRRAQDLDTANFYHDADARLAQQLQAQEYQDDSLQPQSNKRKRRSKSVPDSDESAEQFPMGARIESSDDEVPLVSRKRRAVPQSSSGKGRRQILSRPEKIPSNEDSDLSILNSDQFDDEESEFSALSSVIDVDVDEDDEDDDNVALNAGSGLTGSNSSPSYASLLLGPS
jgi:hypothetical protein